MTNEEYVEKWGLVCPVCGGKDVTATDSPEVSGRHAFQPVCCNTCRAQWTDEYTLVGYSNLEKEN